MRRLAVVSVLVCAMAAPAFAGPKDQTKGSLVGKQAVAGNATVNNNTTAFKYATKGCTLQVQAKGLTGTTDNDVIICVAGADVLGGIFASPAGNSIVITGEVKAGGLKIKADLKEIGCGLPTGDVIQTNGSFRCYLDDSAYRADTGTGNWQDACVMAGASALVNTAVDAKELKNHPGQRVILGVCQAFTAGTRIDPPTSTEIATIGSRQFPIP